MPDRDLAATDALLREALARLYARAPFGMRLGLEAMREASQRAGHPEQHLSVVHVAGTNGKGSTCAMLEAILRVDGKRTGLYTSPHLTRFAERIRIDGEPIDDDTLARCLTTALDVGPELSFFEVATLAALVAFAKLDVDVAILEVGLGGRLDATNVVPSPVACAITSIGLDHTRELGETLSAIAREKAAIAKNGAPMVIGPMPEEARRAAIDVAQRAGARVVPLPSEGVSALGDTAPCEDLPADVVVGLEGAHQRDNARVAWRVAAELSVGHGARRRGIETARWPGRLERMTSTCAPFEGPWILDGAHNEDGARALAAALQPRPPSALVFGALADKAWPAMLDAIVSLPCPRVYVAPEGREAAPPSVLAARAPGLVADSVRRALREARRSAGDGAVLVCGSLYLVGAARAALLDLPTDPPVAL